MGFRGAGLPLTGAHAEAGGEAGRRAHAGGTRGTPAPPEARRPEQSTKADFGVMLEGGGSFCIVGGSVGGEVR